MMSAWVLRHLVPLELLRVRLLEPHLSVEALLEEVRRLEVGEAYRHPYHHHPFQEELLRRLEGAVDYPNYALH
jgi:hypothetical protein